jgi:hypothetical protein
MFWIVAIIVVAVIVAAAWWTSGRNKGTPADQGEHRWRVEGKMWGSDGM